MSKSVDLSREQQAVVLRYLSRHVSKQPSQNSISSFYLLPTSDDEAPFDVTLGAGKHQWSHEGSDFTVEITEEGYPCGDVPTYFTRMRVLGEDLTSLKAFLTAALTSRVPAPPGKIWTNAASRFGHWRETGASPAQSFKDLFLPLAETQVMGVKNGGVKVSDACLVYSLSNLLPPGLAGPHRQLRREW